MNEQKKVAIIGTVGLPANYGGFETLAEHLVRNLSADYDLTVYCSGKRYAKPGRNKKYNGARLVYLPLEANGIQSILYDSISILHALFYADVLLILGVAGAWMLPFVRLMTNKKIVISIDGIEWKRDKWNILAKVYLWWAEKLAVKYSHIDISDNESIQDYTAMRYGTLSRIIEYGADHTLKVAVTADSKLQFPFLKNPYAFNVCRIEPENNVHLILDAFSQMPRHTIVMIGNWEKSKYGRDLKAKYANCFNIYMMDPIYDQKVLDMIRGNALVYIHGHSAGGTNPSLVEAMYLGLPIVAFNVSYNRTTTESRALYFDDVAGLRQLILSTHVGALIEVGQEMKKIAMRRYTWKTITAKYRHLIEEAVLSDEKLPVVPVVAAVTHDELVGIEAGHLTYAHTFVDKR